MPVGMGRGLTTECFFFPLLIAAQACGDHEEETPSRPAVHDAAPTVVRDAGSDAARTPIMDAGKPAMMTDAGSATYTSLIDNMDWRRYDAAVDPLASHQPAQIVCQLSATYVEYGSFEVDTTRCNYLLAWTPSLTEVPVGSEVHINMLHYDLLASEPAQAHIAVLFGDQVQWEEMIPIPSPGNQVDMNFTTTAPLAFQQPIRLHLHNHGGNTYLMVTLEVRDATPSAP